MSAQQTMKKAITRGEIDVNAMGSHKLKLVPDEKKSHKNVSLQMQIESLLNFQIFKKYFNSTNLNRLERL